MINLLPNEMKESIKFARANRILIFYCGVVLVAGLILVGTMFYGKSIISQSKNQLEADLSSSRASIVELESIHKEAEALSSSIDTIGGLINNEMKFSSLLKEIGSIIPPGAVVNSLSLSEDRTGPITLEISAETAEIIGVAQENLADSDLFIGADVTSVQSSANSSDKYKFVGSLEAYFKNETPTATPAPENQEPAS